MRIIRDEECGGLMMIPLLVDWGIRRCNVKGCTNRPNTIIGGMPGVPHPVGLCEEHFQQGKQPGGCNWTLVWDDFDAFAQKADGEEISAPEPLHV